jgi:poly(A) polymerase
MAETSSSARTRALPSLEDAEWLRRPATVRVFEALEAPGVETRAVGGAVRDALGRACARSIFATTAKPDKVMTLARKGGLKAIPTGIEHGTVTIVGGGASFEVTTLRRDVETFGRHATVAFTEDWEEDARRRDFTLNALYEGRDGTVFDPLGGYEDVVVGRVRFIGDAEARIKNYLRILASRQRLLRQGAGDTEGLVARSGFVTGSGGSRADQPALAPVAPGATAIEAFDLALPGVLGGAPRLDRSTGWSRSNGRRALRPTRDGLRRWPCWFRGRAAPCRALQALQC